MAKITREVAYRVFAQELRDTTIVLEREDDKYAAQYVLTPTGAKVNRVFVVGALTEKDDIGTDATYWRVRLTDPTGAFMGYAGEYQPDAARVISNVAIPELLAIVGKVHVYTPEDGGTVVSINPEMVATVDMPAVDRWTLQTAQQTIARIQHLEVESPESVEDMKKYRTMVRDVLTRMTV